MAAGRGGFQPPRAGWRQRCPSLSKEGSLETPTSSPCYRSTLCSRYHFNIATQTVNLLLARFVRLYCDLPLAATGQMPSTLSPRTA